MAEVCQSPGSSGWASTNFTFRKHIPIMHII